MDPHDHRFNLNRPSDRELPVLNLTRIQNQLDGRDLASLNMTDFRDIEN